MIKKKGGTIKNWQTHTLSDKPEAVAMAKEQLPELTEDKIMVFTGIVVDDPLNRWVPGDHMRSSPIMTLDRENGIVETKNTVYKLEGEEGGDPFFDGDMGIAIMSIFY